MLIACERRYFRLEFPCRIWRGNLSQKCICVRRLLQITMIDLRFSGLIDKIMQTYCSTSSYDEMRAFLWILWED